MTANLPSLSVQPSAIHGDGVFIDRPVAAGELVHMARLMVFDCRDTQLINQTQAGHYVFYVQDCPCGCGVDQVGLALSPISFVNHQWAPNLRFAVSAAEKTASFYALRDLAAGDEITIDYEDFADRLGIPR